MNETLLEELSQITPEEQQILDGHPYVDRRIYYDPQDTLKDRIDRSKVLRGGRLIDIRRHVRFVHFPEHTHNFVEFVYMCQGTTTHLIDGQKIVLGEGDLLFLNQHARQEILPASSGDIAVNFMILPEFFDTAFHMLGAGNDPLRNFLVSCLTDQNGGGNYLYFHVAGVLPVQNLVENLIMALKEDSPENQTIARTTMGLLFLYLVSLPESIRLSERSFDEQVMIRLLEEIHDHYRDVRLADLAGQNHMEVSALSRLILRRTGSTFKELLQKRRMEVAAYLLDTTGLSASDIAAGVGYENTSFFHSLFKLIYGMSPKEYRHRKDAGTK